MSESFHSAKSRKSSSSRRSSRRSSRSSSRSSSRRSLNYFTPESYDNKLVEDKKLIQDALDGLVFQHKNLLSRLIQTEKFYKTHKIKPDKSARSAVRGLQKTRTQSLRMINKLKSCNDSLTRKLRESERGDFLRGGTRHNRK